MNNPLRVRIYLSAFILLLAFSCDREEIESQKNGRATFTFNQQAGSNGRVETEAGPAFVFVNIEDAHGNTVVENQKMALLGFGSGYVTESLILPTGSYKLVTFLVLDENSKAIYATPLEGSEKADLVNDPLSIDFTVSENESTSVVPQVLSIQPTDVPEQFGYTSFRIDLVDEASTMDVSVKVELKIGDVMYLDVNSTIVVTGYTSQNELKWAQEFAYSGPYPNALPVKAGYHHYNFEIRQWGVYSNQMILGEYLLEASRQEVPTTYVMGGSAAAKKLSHYITYKKMIEGDVQYWQAQDRRRYEYDAAGNLERMIVSSFVDSVGGFLPQRYFVFNYTGDRMTKIAGYHAETDKLYLEERYEYFPDGNVLSITQDYVDGSNIDWVANYSYNYTNRVINASYSAANGGGFTYDLTLPWGNVLTDRINRGNQLCNIGTYQYDRGINPYKHLGYMDFFLNNFSLNNRISENVEYFGCAFPSLIPEAYVYEYDEQGYPKASNTLYKGRNYETRTTYFYH